jgi:hypothetical protein
VTGLADALTRIGRDVDDIDFVLPTHLFMTACLA